MFLKQPIPVSTALLRNPSLHLCGSENAVLQNLSFSFWDKLLWKQLKELITWLKMDEMLKKTL